MVSIDELSTHYDSDDGSISPTDIENIRDGSQIHPEINVRYVIFKMRDRIRQTQNERKAAELSENSTGKGLYKFFIAVVN